MGHFVQAFVGNEAVLGRIQTEFKESSVIALPQGFALLPMTEPLYDVVPETDEALEGAEGFQFLTSKIMQLLIRFSEGGSLGYFETEYFGGAGDQGAVLAKDGSIVWGPKMGDDSINEILRAMAVEKADNFDEFAAVGLGRFRSNEDWISAA